MHTRSRFLVPVLLTLALAVWAVAAAHFQPVKGTDLPSDDTSGVAVLELFTSEGCSSCPPADRLLRSLVQSARSENRPIYALSFHVDYWNQLGWTDPYSDAQYSRRQRRYSQALRVDTYTPQIVVNGRRAMVGSREGAVRKALHSALDHTPPVELDLAATLEDGALELTYELSTLPSESARLHIALVERGLSQTVERGENAGRTLRHANVVRQFTSKTPSQQGSVNVTIPTGVDRSHASVITYVQDASMAILGAARIDLETALSATSP